MVLLYTGGVFMMGMLVSQFSEYALWVLIYTGGAFMAGLWFGQRWERSWVKQEDEESEITQVESEADVRKPTGLSV